MPACLFGDTLLWWFNVYTVHFTMYIVHCTLQYSCTLCTVHYCTLLYIVHCLHFILYTTLHYCTLLYIVHCRLTLYNYMTIHCKAAYSQGSHLMHYSFLLKRFMTMIQRFCCPIRSKIDFCIVHKNKNRFRIEAMASTVFFRDILYRQKRENKYTILK